MRRFRVVLGTFLALILVLSISSSVLAQSSQPTLSSPENGEEIYDNSPFIDWQPVPGANKYWLQIDDNSNFSSPILDDNTVTTDNYQISASNALSDGLYYWRVRAENADGLSPWSESRDFKVSSKEPLIPIELSFIPALLIILIVAGVGRFLSKKAGQPTILGELVLGIVIGIFVTLAPEAKTPVSDVAGIGILLLLFSVGLDLDLERFKELAAPAIGVAVGGVLLPFVLGYFATIFFISSTSAALFVGTALVATSVGISASILRESGNLRSKVGTLIMGSAVTDDVLGVILMTVMFSVAATGSLSLTSILLPVLLSALFFILSLTVGVSFMRKVSEKISVGKENLLMLGLIIVLTFALITEKIGLAMIIGAFVAGLVLGQTHFSKTLEGPVSLIGGSFFIPIFFVTMGMKFNLGAFASVGIFSVVLLILAITGKIVGCGIGAKMSRFSNMESLATGVAMVPRAEVALIVAAFGLKHGVIGLDIMTAIIVTVVVTTLFTPPLLWRILKKI